jgi:hypothetical protein
VLPVDLNGDGWADVVAGSLDYGIYAWLNQSGKGWKPYAGSLPQTGNFYGLAAADFDADGRPDLCAANWGEGVVIWQGPSAVAGTPAAVSRSSAGLPAAIPSVPALRENDVFKVINGTPEYKIGGDILEIAFWEGNTVTRQDFLVRPDGRFLRPGGELQVSA